MKPYQNSQPHAVERGGRKQNKKGKIKSTQTPEEDKKLDQTLDETFPASDATAEY